MLRINLLPVRQLKRRAKANDQVLGFVMVLVFVVAVLALAYLAQKSQITGYNSRIATMQAQKNKLQSTINAINDLENQKQELNRRIEVIDNLRAESSLTVHILDEVANRIDNKRMWIKSLTQSQAALQLNGIAMDNETVAQFMETLKLSDYVNDVTLVSASTSKVGSRAFMSFSLKCAVSMPSSDNDGKDKKE